MVPKNYNPVNTTIGKLSKSSDIKYQTPPILIREKGGSESKEKRNMKGEDGKMGTKQKKEMGKVFKTYKQTSSQDGGIGRHGSPPCTTTSKLQLKYRITITHNGRK